MFADKLPEHSDLKCFAGYASDGVNFLHSNPILYYALFICDFGIVKFIYKFLFVYFYF